MRPKPTLSVSIAVALRSDAEHRGFWAYVPYLVLVSAGAGFALAYFTPAEFWTDEHWDVSTAVYAGLLAFNGLLMALGWFAFSKMYEILTGDRLGLVLSKHDLLGVHLAFIEISHLALVAASLSTAVGLVSVLLPWPVTADRILFGTTIGATIYALIRAVSSVNVVNHLVWEQSNLPHASTSVTPIGGRDQRVNPGGPR